MKLRYDIYHFTTFFYPCQYFGETNDENKKTANPPFFSDISSIFSLINGIRRTFCNCQSISSTVFLSPNTSPPNNPAPFFLRNRGKGLRPCKLSPTLQISFRTPCICTVKMAYLSPSFFLLFHYTLSCAFSQLFSTYKIAFPDKKLSKKPLTSRPVRSKQPTKSPTDATL